MHRKHKILKLFTCN